MIIKSLDLIDKLTSETAAIFILKDYDNFLKDLSVIRKLKNLSRSLKTQPNLGKGHGPVNHLNSIQIKKNFR